MKLTRRGAIAGVVGAAAAGTAAGAVALRPGAVAAHVLEIVAEVYGPDFAAMPAAREFALAYEEHVDRRGVSGAAVHAVYGLELDRLGPVRHRLMVQQRSIIQKFAMSTNVILAYERGEPLVFAGLYAPHLHPCSNQLSAMAMS